MEVNQLLELVIQKGNGDFIDILIKINNAVKKIITLKKF